MDTRTPQQRSAAAKLAAENAKARKAAGLGPDPKFFKGAKKAAWIAAGRPANFNYRSSRSQSTGSSHTSSSSSSQSTSSSSRSQSTPPPSPTAGRAGGPAFATPRVDAHSLLLVALAAVETAMVAKLGDDKRRGQLADEAPKAFAQYQKLKALALGPQRDVATRTEAYSALRMSVIAALKLTF